MKQKVNPVMAAVTVIVIALVAGILIWKAGSGGTKGDAEKPPGMPADVAKELQQRMGGTTGPGAPNGAAGGPSAGPRGYIAPPTQ